MGKYIKIREKSIDNNKIIPPQAGNLNAGAPWASHVPRAPHVNMSGTGSRKPVLSGQLIEHPRYNDVGTSVSSGAYSVHVIEAPPPGASGSAHTPPEHNNK